MSQNPTATNDTQHPLRKVVAYITAYQDQAALHRCIQAIRGQSYPVEQIIVVDNSPVSLLDTEGMSLLVWPYPNNIGISGGLHKLIEWTTGKQYDFVWMFDQDSEPHLDCLSQLVEAYTRLSTQSPIGIVAPVPIDPRTQYVVPPARFYHDRFEGIELSQSPQPQVCDAPITSGSLLCLKTVASVSPPDTRLFIDGIDLDYGLRLRQAGYQNFVIPQAVMNHYFGYPKTISFLGKKKVFQAYSALRYYYICRNHTYLEFRFSKGLYKLTCIARRMKFLFSQIFWLSIADTDRKLLKMRACIQGTYNGLVGTLDHPFQN